MTVAGADDRYARRNFTLDHDANAALEELAEQFGKGYSETVCLALLALKGNNRLMRHALAQPINALRAAAALLAATCPNEIELHETVRRQFESIESILAPPRIVPPGK